MGMLRLHWTSFARALSTRAVSCAAVDDDDQRPNIMAIDQRDQREHAPPLFSVRGWTIVVTGASAGLGLGFAKALASHGAARVCASLGPQLGR